MIRRLKKSAAQLHGSLQGLAEKAQRVHSNARGSGERHFRRLNNGLFPRETPQERVRGVLEFVAHYGRAWLDELLEEIDPFPTEHLLVYLKEETPRP